ncbi:ROK family protein [Secundilactobacillus sp. HBUAS58055]|uniref:ROK family transcriptional regulator n=1 Tax=Secundilactobacillus angelensis TaxID=2722706 RepID=UPI001E363AEA|nr:ROK family transcriptional regulator [Secundilactobacillus angelensis]MCH5463007.1 ROK family protein [Secundilactobacillus angelensis]
MSSAIRNRMQLHQQNIQSVLAEVFNHQPISRIEISRNLALNKSTVSALYRDLKEAGYVEELGEGDASNVGGRKPVLLAINRRYGYTMNFDFGYRHLHVMQNNLSGDVLSYKQINVLGLTIKQILPLIDVELDKVAAKDKTSHGLLGISFAIHGTVLDNQVTYSPFLDMEQVDLADYYTQKFQVPVLLENEANAAAVYERDFNKENDRLDNMVTISIHRGIGAGLIINQNLHRGTHGEAGEIGRSIPVGGDWSGTPRKVEDFCSEDAIINQIQTQKGAENMTRDDVVRLFNEGDEVTKSALNLFVKSVAAIIYNAANNFDPDVVFLNSPLLEELPELEPQIESFYAQTAPTILVPIKLTKNSHYATLLGGCALVTRQALGMEEAKLNFDAQTSVL